MPEDLPFAADFDQANRLEFSRLKSRARAGRYVESHATSLSALEFESRVHLKKMKMTSYLDGTIPAVAHVQLYRASPFVREDRFRLQKIFPWNHDRIGS